MLNKALLSLFLFVAFAFTARAYQITSPSNNSQAWTVAGPNILAWERVNTDPSTFAIVLVNEDRSVLPVNNQLLASNVDGTLLSISVSPSPSTTFPMGDGFRVNFIKNANDSNTIYAQSSQFTIGQGGGRTSSSTNSVGVSTLTGSSASGVPTPHVTYTASEDSQTVTVTVNAALLVKDISSVLYILTVSLLLVVVA